MLPAVRGRHVILTAPSVSSELRHTEPELLVAPQGGASAGSGLLGLEIGALTRQSSATAELAARNPPLLGRIFPAMLSEIRAGGELGDHGLVALPSLASLPLELSHLPDEEHAPSGLVHVSLGVPAGHFGREASPNAPSGEHANGTYIPPSCEARHPTPLGSHGHDCQTGGANNGGDVRGNPQVVQHEEPSVGARVGGKSTEVFVEG